MRQTANGAGVLPTLYAVCAQIAASYLMGICAASAQSDSNLAQELTNPVASVIQVPFQNNFDWGGGPHNDAFRYTLNIQPVIPLPLNRDWNLIVRTIVPFASFDGLFPQTETRARRHTAELLSVALPSDAVGNRLGCGTGFSLPDGDQRLLRGAPVGRRSDRGGPADQRAVDLRRAREPCLVADQRAVADRARRPAIRIRDRGNDCGRPDDPRPVADQQHLRAAVSDLRVSNAHHCHPDLGDAVQL